MKFGAAATRLAVMAATTANTAKNLIVLEQHRRRRGKMMMGCGKWKETRNKRDRRLLSSRN